jgi:hypothetical protein
METATEIGIHSAYPTNTELTHQDTRPRRTRLRLIRPVSRLACRFVVPDRDQILLEDNLDYREAHYCKILMDEVFGRECFLNEIIWAYDYGARSKTRWPSKHDTILVYVKDPDAYYFDAGAVDREPYMAPGLVTAEKAARGKLPTDVWWHTIVPTNGREKTGYPTQKPEGIVRRMVQASTKPGDWYLDFLRGPARLVPSPRRSTDATCSSTPIPMLSGS